MEIKLTCEFNFWQGIYIYMLSWDWLYEPKWKSIFNWRKFRDIHNSDSFK